MGFFSVQQRVATPPQTIPARDTTTPLGTAAWADGRALFQRRYMKGDFFIGRLMSGEAVGLRDDRGVFIGAGTRGGKGISILVPVLATWPGSVVVVDPKGEGAIVTARRRHFGSIYSHGMRQRVQLLDPFREIVTPKDDFQDMRARFNPLDALKPDRSESIGDAARIADALVVSESSNDPFWEDSARTLIKFLILHVVSWREFSSWQRNLVTVHRLLMAGDAHGAMIAEMSSDTKHPPSGLKILFEAMKRNRAFGGLVADGGAMFANLEETAPRLLGSILQVAMTNTDFLQEPEMQACLKASSFSLSDLKTDPKGISLYITLPQRFMGTHHRWVRMLCTLIVAEMERVRHQPKSGHPILMVLDEFAALKRMKTVENAAAQISGFGVKLVFVTQTLAQLKDIYKDNWETLLASCGTRIFFCNDDQFTRDYAAKLVGEHEVYRQTRSVSFTEGFTTSHTAGSSGSQSISGSNQGMSGSSTAGWSSTASNGTSESFTEGRAEAVHKRLLVTPDEIGRQFGNRNDPMALVLVSGHQPVRIRRIRYYDEPGLDGLYDPHPDHPLPPTLIERKRLRAVEALRQKAEAARLARRLALGRLWAGLKIAGFAAACMTLVGAGIYEAVNSTPDADITTARLVSPSPPPAVSRPRHPSAWQPKGRPQGPWVNPAPRRARQGWVEAWEFGRP